MKNDRWNSNKIAGKDDFAVYIEVLPIEGNSSKLEEIENAKNDLVNAMKSKLDVNLRTAKENINKFNESLKKEGY